MRIVLLTTSNFIINEIVKIEKYTVIVIKTIEELYDLDIYNQKFILFHHLDYFENKIEFFLHSISNDFPKIKLVALRNKINNIEACILLKSGYKAYIHSISNKDILLDVINTLLKDNSWIYPELMQFLIQSVNVTTKENNNTIIKTLNTKELEIIKLVSEAASNKNIAEILNLKEVSIKKYINSLFKKFKVKDRLSLALAYKKIK